MEHAIQINYLLWEDTSKQPVAVKIADAVEAFRRRFETEPDTVLLNPYDFERYGMATVGEVRVRIFSYVRPNNVWVGIEGTS